MEKLSINGKQLEYGSLVMSTSERFALGKESKMDNDAVVVKVDVTSDNVLIPPGKKQLIQSYFTNGSVNLLFFDLYKNENQTTKSLLSRIYAHSISSDALLIGLRKDETKEELMIRLEFARKAKEQGRFVIFMVDPRIEIPVEETKEYLKYIDVIGLYCNVPFGGKPFITKIIQANLEIWHTLEKPIFLFGIPRKMGEGRKVVKYYHPFFTMLGNMFCTHFRYGPSNSKYTNPQTNTIYTYEKLVQEFGENYSLSGLCVCESCIDNTVKSFFSENEGSVSKRIRVHETHITQEQIDIIKKSDKIKREAFLSSRIDNKIGPQMAVLGEINNLGIKGSLKSGLVDELIEGLKTAEKNTNKN